MVPERACFLHVGTVKTGSSALQYALAHSHDNLLTRGYDFPDTSNRRRRMQRGAPTGGNASEIQRALRGGDVELALGCVKPYVEAAHHLIFSNEVLFRSAGPVMDQFCKGLRGLGFVPKCMVVFRPQTELLVSAYLQLVKSNADDVPSTLADYAAEQDFKHNRNWLGYAQRLEDSFGRDHLTVQWYPALRRKGGIINVAFTQWLGLPVPALAEPRINPTPGHEAFTILQIVNAHGWGGRKFADPFLIKAEDAGLLGSKMSLDAKSALTVYEATRASNEALLRRYCPDLNVAEELKPPSAATDTRSDPQTIAGLARLAADLLVQSGKHRATVERAFATLALSET